ncbi:MAG: DUF2142 domain-containing protein [Candidatus Nomurabacteria bacterium]|nr:MAG: DUF2142 domain-containing protein [Candidatus Nomurabacteria bacterium]
MHWNWEYIQNLIVKKLSSRGFLIFVIALFVIQALWIALSYRFPMLYDEAYHIYGIDLFSKQLSPLIMSQPSSYDVYGAFGHGGATLFHYLLSFPYRFISLFTSNLAVHVIAMRVINIIMAATGVYLYAKLFSRLRVKAIYTNISLLIFTLIPITTFVAATTNYDNLLFPLTALYLIWCVDILQSKNIRTNDYLQLFLLGCVTSLVKSTFLPVFAASVVFLGVYLYRKNRKKFISKVIESFKKNSKKQMYIIASLTIIIIGLFSSVYFYNFVAYKTLQPGCNQVIGKVRCSKNYLGVRDEITRETKGTRSEITTADYISLWTMQMVNWSAMTGAHTTDKGVVVAKPIPAMYSTIFIAGVLGISLLLYAWRSLDKNISWYFLVMIMVSLTITVFIQNYHVYLDLREPYAIQPRYLLTIVPIAIIMSVAAGGLIIRKVKPVYKLLFVAIFFALLTQGGGVTTDILLSKDSWYWNSEIVHKLNHGAKKILNPLVKGA